VARRRGFFAEIQHQVRVAEQQQRASDRERQAAARRVDAAHRAEERARAAASRADEVERRQLEKELAVAHAESMQAEVDSLNAELSAKYDVLDSLLAATLEVDDFVDLESLRAKVSLPGFPSPGLRTPLPLPVPLPDPPLPVRREVEPPAGVFGRKRRFAEASALADQQYAADYFAWQAATDALPAQRLAQQESYQALEQERLTRLAKAEEEYAILRRAIERRVAEQNARLDDLITSLAYGTVEAVQEYVGIVLANSVYPEWFPVAHTASFDPANAELDLRVVVPGPQLVPTVKSFRYVKASDTIAESPLSQKEIKDRYASVVHSIALRSLHEVFEADRRQLIQTISLELGTETISPATGREAYIPFVSVATSRLAFEEIDLSGVVPSATLNHLGAVVSKNPAGLAAADGSGVRRV
jgi:restriction system protein